jgi:hypothetical protein
MSGAATGIGERVIEVQRLWKQIYNWPDTVPTNGSRWDHLFADGERFAIGEMEASVLPSPCHTLASITYVIGNAAFVHDAVFMPDSGTARADFPGGDARQLWRSIQHILQLPSETRLFTESHSRQTPTETSREDLHHSTDARLRAARHSGHDTVDLFSPYRLGDLKLNNRMVLSPMTRCRRRLAGAVAAIAAVCAGPAVPVALAQEITPCAALAGRSIEPALIGLPGGPARIASAAMERLPASQGAESSISYCKVLGEIAPLDPAAPPIRFEVNLPEQWNGKAVQYGGGGFNGVLITGLDPLRDARFDTPVPVARGYGQVGPLPTAPSPSTSAKSSTPSTASHRLPRRIAIALHLKADLRIGIGAEHPVPLSLEDRVVRVSQSRGGVQNRGGVLPRVGLRNRWGCHESGKGNGGHYDLRVCVHDSTSFENNGSSGFEHFFSEVSPAEELHCRATARPSCS